MSWKDAEKLRSDWDGPFALKGIVSVEDAKKADVAAKTVTERFPQTFANRLQLQKQTYFTFVACLLGLLGSFLFSVAGIPLPDLSVNVADLPLWSSELPLACLYCVLAGIYYGGIFVFSLWTFQSLIMACTAFFVTIFALGVRSFFRLRAFKNKNVQLGGCTGDAPPSCFG